MERMLSMRKILLFSMMVVFMTTFFVNKTFAQGGEFGNEQQIPWENYAVSPDSAMGYSDGIYLCCMTTQNGVNTYRFVNSGGDNGTHAVLGDRGIRFDLEKDGSGYKFKSSMKNPNPSNGQYLGEGSGLFDNGIYLDQDRTWTIQNGNIYYTTSFIIGTSYHYLTSSSNGALSTVGSAPSNTQWLIIPRVSFRDVLLSVTAQTNINVSGLFLNTRFLRNIPEKYSWSWYDWDGSQIGAKISEDVYNKDGKYVSVTNDQGAQLGLTHVGIEEKGAFRGISPYIGNGGNYPYASGGYVTDYGAFGTAEMREPIIMRQTYDGLKPGTYVITAQAFVSDDNQETGKITNGNNIGYLFAAGTDGISEGALIPQLTSEEQTAFNGYITRHQAEFNSNETENDVQYYFRRNVAAGEFLATNNGTISRDVAIYTPDETNHLVTIAVTVTESEPGKNDGTLTIGVTKNTAEGRLYVDNIKIYYSGSNEFGLNAYSTKNGKMTSANLGGIDENKYEFNRRFNLSRDFGETSGTTVTDPKWEALVMPVNLTKTQVLATFGDNAELCELEGLINDGYRIQFNPVPLKEGSGNDIAIYAGECYAVKVTDAPGVARNEPYQFNVYSKDAGINGIIKYSGPIYQFEGVTRANTLTDLLTGEEETPKYEAGKVTKTYKTGMGGGHDLLFTGYFYRPESVPALSYVLSAGKVYYLNSTWNGLIGTMWTLQEVDAAGNVVKSKNVSVDFGGGQTNGIESIESEDAPAASATGVYNLNGQKVSDGNSTDNLPKGIYIVNGRKMVVR